MIDFKCPQSVIAFENSHKSNKLKPKTRRVAVASSGLRGRFFVGANFLTFSNFRMTSTTVATGLSAEGVKREKRPVWYPPTAVDGTGLRVANSLTETVEPFAPREGRVVRWYTLALPCTTLRTYARAYHLRRLRRHGRLLYRSAVPNEHHRYRR